MLRTGTVASYTHDTVSGLPRTWVVNGRNFRDLGLVFGPDHSALFVQANSEQSYLQGEFMFGVEAATFWSGMAPRRASSRFCRNCTAGRRTEATSAWKTR